jgi:hypothetical protein
MTRTAAGAGLKTTADVLALGSRGTQPLLGEQTKANFKTTQIFSTNQRTSLRHCQRRGHPKIGQPAQRISLSN